MSRGHLPDILRVIAAPNSVQPELSVQPRVRLHSEEVTLETQVVAWHRFRARACDRAARGVRAKKYSVRAMKPLDNILRALSERDQLAYQRAMKRKTWPVDVRSA